MIYGSEKHKRQNSCVYEKRSRRSFITENVARYEKLKPVPSAKNVICVTFAIYPRLVTSREAAPRSLFCAPNELDDLSEMRFELAVNLIGLSNDGYF